MVERSDELVLLLMVLVMVLNEGFVSNLVRHSMALLIIGLRCNRLYLAVEIQVGRQINRSGDQLGKFAIFVAVGALGHLHSAWIAVISLRACASDSGESGKQSYKLEHFMGGDAHTEREDIAPRVFGLLLFTEPSNVVGVIQEPFTVKADVAAQKCVKTNQAGVARTDGVDAPGDMQWSAIRLNGCEDSPRRLRESGGCKPERSKDVWAMVCRRSRLRRRNPARRLALPERECCEVWT